MKKIMILIFSFVLSSPSLAGVLLERELFNAINGEHYVCRIHDNMQTEIINEGQSVGSFPTKFTSADNNVKSWMSALKAQSSNAKMIKKITYEYILRGTKVYSVYDGNKKIPYYTLNTYVDRGGNKQKERLGSIESKVKNDNGNVQRLRVQTDEACKNAISKL